MSFETLKSKLAGSLDILPPSLLDSFINDGLLDIYRCYDWGFLTKEDYLRTPALISTGLANVLEYSTQVTLNAAASAAIMAINPSDVLLEERQFRTNSTTQTGQPFWYNISAVDTSTPTAVVLTIDPPFLDINNAAATFQIAKVYYNPPTIVVNNSPVIDFREWKFIIDFRMQRKLHIDTSLEEVNRFDPARWACDEPRHVLPHAPNSDGIPFFEFYPVPRFKRIYRCIYQRKGLELVENEDVPLSTVISDDLIISRAKYKLYEHALANMHKYPELKGSGGRFQNLMALTMNPNDFGAFPRLLERAKDEDRANYPRSYLGSYMNLNYYDSFFGDLGNNYELPRYTAILNF